MSQNHDGTEPPQVASHLRKKTGKITIVQAAAPQELEIDTNPVKSEKVVVGILEIEKVTESVHEYDLGFDKLTSTPGGSNLEVRVLPVCSVESV